MHDYEDMKKKCAELLAKNDDLKKENEELNKENQVLNNQIFDNENRTRDIEEILIKEKSNNNLLQYKIENLKEIINNLTDIITKITNIS